MAEPRTGSCRRRARPLQELRRSGEWLMGPGSAPPPPQVRRGGAGREPRSSHMLLR